MQKREDQRSHPRSSICEDVYRRKRGDDSDVRVTGIEKGNERKRTVRHTVSGDSKLVKRRKAANENAIGDPRDT